MAAGKIKWFNNAKGWGFIIPEEGGEEVFVHFSAIVGSGYRTLNAQQCVAYTTEQREKGLHALEVIII